MKVLRGLVAALAIVSAASAASAATTAWYTAGASGGPGTVLDLSCDTTGPAGTCSYSVVMHIDGDDQVGLIAWASNLHSSSGNDSATGAALDPGNPFNSLAQAGTGGSGLNLLSGSQGQTFGAPVTTPTNLISFTLNHAFTTGATGQTLITEQASDGATGVVWAGGDGDYATVSFAGGPAAPHPELSVGGLVIRITNVPEPATLSMLGLGALALLRRRR